MRRVKAKYQSPGGPNLSIEVGHAGISNSFGPLQILMNGSEANRTTAGDCPQPQTHGKLQSKNFLDLTHGQSPGWQAILPFSGRLPASVLSSAAGLMEIRAQAEPRSGIGLKLFGFIAESVFTFIPDSCSRSPRNSVRNHPGIAFTFPRIPQPSRPRACGWPELIALSSNSTTSSAQNVSEFCILFL